MKSLSEDLVKASADLIIFSVLEKGSIEFDELRQKLIDNTKGYIMWEYGRLSAHLHMLEQKKYVESFWREGDTRFGNRQKLYRMSSLGKQELEEKRKSWAFIDAVIQHKKVTKVL